MATILSKEGTSNFPAKSAFGQVIPTTDSSRWYSKLSVEVPHPERIGKSGKLAK
jgi:hypothetical protein